MKLSIVLVCLLTISCSSSGQEKFEDSIPPSKEMKLLIESFNTRRKLPDSICLNILKIDGYPRSYFEVRPKELRRYNNLYLGIFNQKCGAGGICERQVMYIFDNEKVISKFNIGSASADDSFHLRYIYEFVNDSLIQSIIKEKRYEYDEDEEEDFLAYDSTKTEYHIIKSTGFVSQIKLSVPKNREYPITGYRLVDIPELLFYSKDQLDVMRNEIFASYGYSFKTGKWREYFSSKEWYEAKDVDVNDLLNPIEKINVQRILEASKKK